MRSSESSACATVRRNARWGNGFGKTVPFALLVHFLLCVGPDTETQTLLLVEFVLLQLLLHEDVRLVEDDQEAVVRVDLQVLCKSSQESIDGVLGDARRPEGVTNSKLRQHLIDNHRIGLDANDRDAESRRVFPEGSLKPS